MDQLHSAERQENEGEGEQESEKDRENDQGAGGIDGGLGVEEEQCREPVMAVTQKSRAGADLGISVRSHHPLVSVSPPGPEGFLDEDAEELAEDAEAEAKKKQDHIEALARLYVVGEPFRQKRRSLFVNEKTEDDIPIEQ
uniref:Uncharacterized protein n=1 Tax=Chromera velia CCMP2878 TaxID=1169474 RepID=A0A0G4IAH2_9ALVE|eukprot:Cvel_12542.t1-p1 / transcript=Cvel_12542.t1 / gene=Cvel_12542 / organism=Chromera_velia_CCMP2878 / gene_product=hypothetical protein / transcript_product=hypothetical protein / location=Cvel_scaffold824:22593-23009(-) / protein_length=139 / sequence_SO=supercontig / SO=protein_coding / is_pseudo=false